MQYPADNDDSKEFIECLRLLQKHSNPVVKTISTGQFAKPTKAEKRLELVRKLLIVSKKIVNSLEEKSK